MPASDQVLPQRLVAIRRRFEHWRRQRTVGSRIPEQLWKAAVAAAREFGIHPTAKALGLDYYSLKRRLEASSADSSLCDTASKGFVELAPLMPASMPECLLEIEDTCGTKLRLHCKGLPAADLAALSRSLWTARS